MITKNTWKPFRLEAGCNADFVFVEGVSRTLLSQETAVELDISRIGAVEASSVSGEIDSNSCVKESYLLKEYELKLLVDDAVKPVAQRRIRYRLREKVNKKLD